MVNNNLNLGPGETVVVENDNVTWVTVTTETVNLQKLVLSNQNLICVYRQREKGLLSRSQLCIDHRPISDIKVIEDAPQIRQSKHPSHGICLEIKFLQGSEYFVFHNSRKSTIQSWRDAIWGVLTGEPAPAELRDSRRVFLKKEKRTEDKDITSKKTSMEKACPHCGARLSADSRYCSNCGMDPNSLNEASQQKSSSEQTSASSQSTRQQFHAERVNKYAGTLIKCPACGENLPSFVGNCPSCGHEINSAKIDDTIEEFTTRISRATTDGEKKRIIDSFSFPNDRESILEGLLYIRGQMEFAIVKEVNYKRSRLQIFLMPHATSGVWLFLQENQEKQSKYGFKRT